MCGVSKLVLFGLVIISKYNQNAGDTQLENCYRQTEADSGKILNVKQNQRFTYYFNIKR